MIGSSKLEINLLCYLVVIISLLVVASMNTSVFSYLGNISLTPEQLTEVDKDPKPIASGCNQKIELRKDAGVLSERPYN